MSSDSDGDMVTNDVATLTCLDRTMVEVVLPPYPNFPDSAPKIVSWQGRLFDRTSTFGYGAQGSNTYQEFVPPEVTAKPAKDTLPSPP